MTDSVLYCILAPTVKWLLIAFALCTYVRILACLCHCLLLSSISRAAEAPCGHMGEGDGPSGAGGGGGATREVGEQGDQQTQQVSGGSVCVCVCVYMCVYTYCVCVYMQS